MVLSIGVDNIGHFFHLRSQHINNYFLLIREHKSLQYRWKITTNIKRNVPSIYSIDQPSNCTKLPMASMWSKYGTAIVPFAPSHPLQFYIPDDNISSVMIIVCRFGPLSSQGSRFSCTSYAFKVYILKNCQGHKGPEN